MLDRSTPDDRPPTDATPEARAVKFRGAGFVPSAGRRSGWIALLLAIALWQLAASAALVNPLFLPPPTAIARAIYPLRPRGAVWHHFSLSILLIRGGLGVG